jgi:hypothetical protein
MYQHMLSVKLCQNQSPHTHAPATGRAGWWQGAHWARRGRVGCARAWPGRRWHRAGSAAARGAARTPIAGGWAGTCAQPSTAP